MPRAIAHPRDDILPETLFVNVLDIGFLSLRVRAAPRSARLRDYMSDDRTSFREDGAWLRSSFDETRDTERAVGERAEINAWNRFAEVGVDLGDEVPPDLALPTEVLAGMSPGQFRPL